MNKILLIGAFALFNLLSYHKVSAQEKVKLVYAQSSEHSMKELLLKTEGKSDKRKVALAKYRALEKEGKIILSTAEYALIKARIRKADKTPANSEEMELAVYAKKASKTYVPVTDLLKAN